MNWYLKAIRQYADFKGRSRRKEYWMFVLFNFLVSVMFKIIDNIFDTTYGDFNEEGILETIYTLLIFIPYLAVTARRMHDAGKSAWFMLIPIYNLILACTDSEPHPNKWGDNPKGLGNDKMIDQIGLE